MGGSRGPGPRKGWHGLITCFTRLQRGSKTASKSQKLTLSCRVVMWACAQTRPPKLFVIDDFETFPGASAFLVAFNPKGHTKGSNFLDHVISASSTESC